jgi:hypothetical protein
MTMLEHINGPEDLKQLSQDQRRYLHLPSWRCESHID